MKPWYVALMLVIVALVLQIAWLRGEIARRDEEITMFQRRDASIRQSVEALSRALRRCLQRRRDQQSNGRDERAPASNEFVPIPP